MIQRTELLAQFSLCEVEEVGDGGEEERDAGTGLDVDEEVLIRA